VLTMTDDPGWDGDTRMLDAAVLGEYLGELDGYTFMIAGPPQMVESVAGALRDAGLPEEQVLPDSFSGY
jgi:NAD(P)H-flavin reductase